MKRTLPQGEHLEEAYYDKSLYWDEKNVADKLQKMSKKKENGLDSL